MIFDIDSVAKTVVNQMSLFNCTIEVAWNNYMHELVTQQFTLDEIKDKVRCANCKKWGFVGYGMGECSYICGTTSSENCCEYIEL